MDVSIRELKNHLSEYLRRVQAGEEVIVTSRGRRIARLSGAREPLSAGELERAAVDRLSATPWIRTGTGGRVRGADRPVKWPKDEKPLSEQILDERE